MFACASPDEPEPGFCLGEVKPAPEKKKPRRGRSRERPKARRKESAADEAPPRIDVKIDAAVPPAAVDGDDPKRSLGRKNVSERLLRVGAAVKEKLVHLAENLEAAPKHVALSASELIEEGGQSVGTEGGLDLGVGRLGLRCDVGDEVPSSRGECKRRPACIAGHAVAANHVVVGETGDDAGDRGSEQGRAFGQD